MCWDPRPSHAACMLRAARTNMVSVILEDNYIQFRILSLGQRRAALKNTVNRRTNTGRSSLSLSHTQRTHTLAQIHPCNWVQLTLPPLSPRLTLCLALSAVRRPNGTIICNFCSNLTDHLPSKWNSTLEKKKKRKNNNNEEKIRLEILSVVWSKRAQGTSRATLFPGI